MRHRGNFRALLFPHLINHQHCRRGMRLFEIITDLFSQNGRRERTERFAFLNSFVENVLHVGASWIDDNRSITKRTWPKLHSSLKPSNYCAVSNVSRRASRQLTFGMFFVS